MQQYHNYLLPSYTINARVKKSDIDKKSPMGNKIYPKGISSSSFQRAWRDGYTGENIIVAVIDTGIDTTHPDLQNKVIKTLNLTDESISDDHGTHVAGTIAANGYLVGGAYNCKLI